MREQKMSHTRTQDEHAAINAREYPGTRQLCVACDLPTGRCEEDSIYLEAQFEHQVSLGPLCEECFDERLNAEAKGSVER